MATEIGIIKILVGTAFAKTPNGVQRPLQAGDIVYENETILTGNFGALEIELPDGSLIDLGRNSETKLDPTALAAELSESNAPDDVEQLQQAILEGADPTQAGEATAAGPDGQGGNEGTTIVQVEHLAPETTPTSGFDTTGINAAFAGGTEPTGDQVVNDLPSVSINNIVTLDDDALGGNPGGVNDDDPNSQNISGTLAHDFGDDGAGTILLAATGSPTGFSYNLSNGGTTLTVNQNGTNVIEINLRGTSTGAYTISQLAPINHESGDAENNQLFNFNYIVTDGNGDSVNGSLRLSVDDDTPVATADTGSITEGALLTVDAASGVLTNDNFGADGPAPIAITGVAAGNNTATAISGGVGVAIAGAYGDLTLAVDGSYTYQATANAITADMQDTFVYTIEDSDGDTSTVTLTIDIADITLTPDNATEVVNEAGLPAGSDAASDSNIVEGQLAVAGTGVEYTLNSNPTGNNGSLILNADGSFEYTLTSPVDSGAIPGTNTVNGVETFNYTATDDFGNTTTGTITINVVDDVPFVIDNSISSFTVTNHDNVSSAGYNSSYGYYIKDAAGNPVSGVVIWDNVKDADTTPVTISGQFTPDQVGFFIIPNGDRTNPNLTDNTEVTFRLNNNGEWTAVDAGQDLIGNGSPVFFDNAALNKDNEDHLQDNVLISNQNWEDLPILTGDGDFNDVNVNVEWLTDIGSVTEGDLLTVDAASGVLTNDNFGADGPAPIAITGVAAGNNTATAISGGVGIAIAGAYGDLTLAADGSYTYQATANAITADMQDTFVYTIADNDGDTSTVTLTINVADITLTPDNATEDVNEAGLSAGSDAASDSNIVEGQLAVAGTDIVYTLNSNPTGNNGSLTLNANGSFEYTLTSPVDSGAIQGTNTVNGVETFNYTATDDFGNTTTGTITINVIDDVPSISTTSPGTTDQDDFTVNGATYVTEVQNDPANGVVDHWQFHHEGGQLIIDLDSERYHGDLNGDGDTSVFDSYLYLFETDDNGNIQDVVTRNDDVRGPTRLDSGISIDLPEGHYDLAVGAWPFSETEARGDTHDRDMGTYNITFSGDNDGIILESSPATGSILESATSVETTTATLSANEDFDIDIGADTNGASIDFTLEDVSIQGDLTSNGLALTFEARDTNLDGHNDQIVGSTTEGDVLSIDGILDSNAEVHLLAPVNSNNAGTDDVQITANLNVSDGDGDNAFATLNFNLDINQITETVPPLTD